MEGVCTQPWPPEDPVGEPALGPGDPGGEAALPGSLPQASGPGGARPGGAATPRQRPARPRAPLRLSRLTQSPASYAIRTASPRALCPTPSGPGVSHRVLVRARGQGPWARGVAQCDAPTRPGGLGPPRVAVLRCAPSFLTPVLVSPSADRPTSSSQHRHPQTACGLAGPRDPEFCCQRHEAWLGEGVAVARAGDCRALRNLLRQLRGCAGEETEAQG